jgi:beta-lactamase superfamily hydrolase
MVKITVLNDNRKLNDSFENEHGLALLIEVDGKTILMDAGQTEIYKHNAQKLGIDLDRVGSIVLSHGDYDHGNGLKYFDKKVDLICHPNCSCYRKSKRTGNFDGLNQTEQELEQRFNLHKSSSPYNVSENVIFLGEITRKNDFEIGNLPMTNEEGKDYSHLDDSGLVIKTENGLIVISGCAHSGICNTIEYAKRITGDERILSVIGGFHLKEVDDRTVKTIEYMKQNNVKSIYLAHCTSDAVCQEFLKQMPEIARIMKTGMTYEFKEKSLEER